MTQLRNRDPVLTLPLAQAITIRLFPVNNSAPPTTTKTSPRQKTRPVNNLAIPKGNVLVPAAVFVANTAPSAIKAPANTDKVNIVSAGASAFRTPTYAALV